MQPLSRQSLVLSVGKFAFDLSRMCHEHSIQPQLSLAALRLQVGSPGPRPSLVRSGIDRAADAVCIRAACE